MIDRQRPRHAGGRRRLSGRRVEDGEPPVELLPVFHACHPGTADCRRGVRECHRLAVQVLEEVNGAAALVWVRREPADEVAHRLAAAERADLHDEHVAEARHRLCVGRGDHDLSRRSARPQPLEHLDIRQVVEHHEPAPVGAAEPAQEARGDRLGVAGQPSPGEDPGRLDVAGQDGRRAARVDPDQQVGRPGTPLRLGEECGLLRLPAASQPVM